MSDGEGYFKAVPPLPPVLSLPSVGPVLPGRRRRVARWGLLGKKASVGG